MPIIFPGFRRSVSPPGKIVRTSHAPQYHGVVPPSVQTSKGAPVQQTRHTNPRAAAPVPTTISEATSKKLVDETKTLGAAVVSGQSYPLPTDYDIVNAILNLSLTFTSGSTGTGNIQASTAISEIRFINADGIVVADILGTQLHMLYERFSLHMTDFLDPSKAVPAAAANTVTNTQIPLPYLRLPSANGPFQIQIIYNPLSALGSYASDNGPKITPATDITAASIVCGITVLYGNAEGVTSYISSTNLPVSPGFNNLSQRMPVQNQSVAELFMYGFAADTDLEYLSIDVNGQTIETYLGEGDLSARDEQIIQAPRPAGMFWLLETSQIAFNASSTFNLFLSTSATTTAVYFVFYRLA